MSVHYYISFGKTTQRLLTRGYNLEAASSHFCQPLFEGVFTITPEEAIIRKLPAQYDYSLS